MDEIVGKILLAADKFMPEMHLYIVLGNYLQKNKAKKEHTSLKKQEIHDIIIKTD